MIAVAFELGGLILVATNRIRSDMQPMRTEIQSLRTEQGNDTEYLRTEVQSIRSDLSGKLDNLSFRMSAVENGQGRLEGLLERRGLL